MEDHEPVTVGPSAEDVKLAIDTIEGLHDAFHKVGVEAVDPTEFDPGGLVAFTLTVILDAATARHMSFCQYIQFVQGEIVGPLN